MDKGGLLHDTLGRRSLEKPTHMYDALGKRRPGVVKAVIAARYENASQTFNKLCTKFMPLSQVLPATDAQSRLLDDTFTRLTTWGHETGAEDQTLDYKLRKSKDMHETVVEALQELQGSLDEGLQLMEDDRFQEWSNQLGDQDGDLSPAVQDEGVFRDEFSASDATATEEISPLHVQTDEIIEIISDVFEFVEDCVENLIRLGPSLDHPYPQDIDRYSSSLSSKSDISDQLDIARAKLEFPAASSILQTRLGRANWKRRIAQIVIQEQVQKDGKIRLPKSVRKKTARQEVAQDAFNFQKPTLKREEKTETTRPLHAAPKLNMFLPLMSATASSAAVSDTASIFDSDPPTTSASTRNRLARNESATTLATMATFESLKKTRPLSASGPAGNALTSLQQPPAKEALFPRPPLPLAEIPKGRTEMFTCNFCGYDLEAGGTIQSDADWNQHLLEDLEPYLCTFDRCFSAQETYAHRDEWYKHELESHRIRKTWACPACMQEFHSKQEATDHLVQTHYHDQDGGQDLELLKSKLRQTLSGQQHLGAQICPLCREKVEARACKEHIGRHLEYFALLSIIDDGFSEEDDSDEIFSQSDDDVMSERGRKEMVLNTFVTEQFKMNLERGKQPPDRFMDGSNSQFELWEDMSEKDGGSGRGGGGESSASVGEESRQLLMERMLQGGSGGSGGDVKRARERRLSTGQKARLAQWEVGPPSQTSSTEKLPLIRTWSSPRNTDFMGRDKELANLYKILSEPGKVCVVSAEGGMGKTALAVEYTWRFEQSYHYIFWIQAETAVGSSDTFCQIAQQLRLAPDGTDQDTLVRLGREFLESVQDRRWLMVLDNVDKWEDIDVYTPTKTSATQGSILITTRHDSFTAPSRPFNYFRIALQELALDEGRKLLIHGLPEDLRPAEMSLRDPEYKVAGEIASLVGLPLLIVYISGYIKKSGCTLSEFWEYWNEWRPNAHISSGSSSSGGRGEGAEGDTRDGDGTPDKSGRDGVFYMALRDLSVDEMKLLKIMAFFDSDGIQREALEWNDGKRPGPSYLRKNRLRLIISKLKGQSIVTEKKHGEREMYSVHRLLQSKLLQEMNANSDEYDEIFGIAFDLIRGRLPRPSPDTPEPSKWNAFKEYLPHVLSLQRVYADPLSIVTVKPFPGLAELFKDGGVLLWQRYNHGDALKLLYSAEKVLDQLPDPRAAAEHESLRTEISITVNLLLQYFGISYRKEIKERSAKILAYREGLLATKKAASPDAVTTEDQLVWCNAQADYANTMLQFNDYAHAEPIYESCLTTYLAVGDTSDGATSFAVAKLHHHLAYCKMYRRAFAEALALSEKAVHIIEKVSDMAMTLRYRFDQACIMLQSGNLDQALAMHHDIFKARLGFQGRASYFTLQSQYAVAALYHYLGRLDEAEMLMKSALNKAAVRGGKNFWPEAAVARTKYHLSLVMLERDKQRDQKMQQTALLGQTGGAHASQDEDKSSEERQQRAAEARQLAFEGKDILSRMLPYDPEPITGVREEDTLALFDHLQPVFGGRFTSTKLLAYVS